jgi:uncharacterized protein (DUF433 family)
MMQDMSTIDLLDRPVYGMSQVDGLLGLNSGTARRWIDGYTRGAKEYPPVVRFESSGSDVVTWGEFVETRFLAEYREKGVPLIRMRPAIDVLRERFGSRYPLAQARPFVADRELVMAAQEEVSLERALYLVVVRKGQLMLNEPAENFYRSVDFASPDGIVTRVRPLHANSHVVMDPLRQFGQPVVRSVPTEVIAEQMRAGDRLEAIAEIYELTMEQVEAAIQYELTRTGGVVPDAA